jgi:hypothetical protein
MPLKVKQSMPNLPARPNKVPFNVMLTLAASLGMWTFPGFAGQTNNGFLVSVQLIPAPQTPPNVPPNVPPIVPPGLPISAFCKKNNIPSAHGALVTVVCTTGAVVAIEPDHAGQPFTPMHGGAYRYVTNVTPNGDLSDTVDAFSGAGTTTAWRVVKSAGRDYLEMTLGW